MPVRICTLNTWGLPFPLAYYPRRIRYPRIERWLRTEAHDVVALQEVWHGAPRLEVNGLFRADHARGDSGLALCAAHPVHRVVTHHFASASGLDALKRKGVLHAEVSFPGARRVHVLTTHLQADASRTAALARAAQVEHLLELTGGLSGPCVLAGDFNFHHRHADDEATLRRLTSAGWTDAAERFASAGTWWNTRHRFDRIFTRDGREGRWRHLGASTVRSGQRSTPFLSDHQAVCAEVSLD